MSIGDTLRNLPGPEDRPAFNPQPKSATPSRLETKDAKDKDDERKLKAWRDEVFDRDEGLCRCCGCKVIRLRVQVLNPRRFESHHVAGRDDKAVRHDRRNGLALCLKCHGRVTGTVGGRLVVVGTVFFVKAKQRYINADHQVVFKEAA